MERTSRFSFVGLLVLAELIDLLSESFDGLLVLAELVDLLSESFDGLLLLAELVDLLSESFDGLLVKAELVDPSFFKRTSGSFVELLVLVEILCPASDETTIATKSSLFFIFLDTFCA